MSNDAPVLARTGGPRNESPQANGEQRLAYVLLRLMLGVNLLGHGLIRIVHGVAAFAAGMVKQMADAPLPPALISLVGHFVPWIELILGTLLVLGFLTRQALVIAMLFLIALMLGITLKQDWPTAGLQLLYGSVVFVLLYLRGSKDASWFAILRDLRTGA